MLVVEESAAKENNQKLGYIAEQSENGPGEEVPFRCHVGHIFPIVDLMVDSLKDVLVAHVDDDRKSDNLQDQQHEFPGLQNFCGLLRHY